ncbi:hypothetical protein DERP_010149 [Dermatophagoides pteronyssinus]|uniref:Uncharacterized protein n=1 Tax=Dermatophagoides pteronyssinus TaxID=6956 RepID=A0ABQ8J6S0_DERPT|nr:hypothetical protein DERP_010149 [Dermatophagoides pteronyssinus]
MLIKLLILKSSILRGFDQLDNNSSPRRRNRDSGWSFIQFSWNFSGCVQEGCDDEKAEDEK